MSDRDLMRLHVEALFTHDDHGDLVSINEPAGRPAPGFFIGVTRDATVRRFRHDVSVDLRRELDAECERSPAWLRGTGCDRMGRHSTRYRPSATLQHAVAE
jgi:hypothetical protein